MKKNNRFCFSQITLFILVAILSFSAPFAHADGTWQTVAQLMDEQKFNAASNQVDLLLKKSKAAKNNSHWRQALVLGTTLRLKTQPIEETVNFLTNQQWPSDNDSKLLLNLYLSKVLTQYVRQNHWQIHNRETIKSNQKIGIEKKTIAQINADINLAFKAAYQLAQARQNDALNSLSLEGFKAKNNYFSNSNYPPNVRGGIKDTIVYLWVGHLLDNSMWSIKENSEKSKLTVDQLLSPSLFINPVDTSKHSLLRAISLLNQLEQQELKRDRPEAALEAFRVKITAIASHQSAANKKPLMEKLRERINGVDKNRAWTNMLRNDLARMILNTNTPDANIRSLKVLDECLSLHTDQKVTRSCQAQQQLIKKPELGLTSMIVDGLDKRSVQITHANIDKIYFKAWKLKKQEAILNKNQQYYEKILKSKRKADSTWETKLPPTKDYRTHKTFLTPPIKSKGYWLMVASMKPDFSLSHNNVISSSEINLSDFVVTVNASEKDVAVRIFHGETGRVEAKVNVELWSSDYRTPYKKVENGLTHNDGSYNFSKLSRNNNFLVVAQTENEFSIHKRVNRYYGGQNPKVTNALVFTDRAIYRPGQKIKWKVIAYEGNSDTGKYRVLPNKKGTATLFDANGKEVQEIAISSNQYGSASGEFTAKTGLLLGQWSIRTSFSGYKNIRVEEYKRPTFEVKIKPTEESLGLNQWAEVTGSARYYFGQAVTDGKVKWRVERQAFSPWQHGYQGREIKPLNVASGDIALDEKGEFLIKFLPKEVNFGKKTANEIIHQYIITADITNAGGETRSVNKTLNIGNSSIRANINNSQTYNEAGNPFELTFQRTDLDGEPRAGSGFWTLQKIQQPNKVLLGHEIPNSIDKQYLPYATDGDKLKPRWEGASNYDNEINDWKVSNVIQKGGLRHKEDGSAELKLTIPQAGLYKLKYSTKDKAGKLFETNQNLTIAGKNIMPFMLPVVLKTKASSVSVGGNVELLMGSGFANQPYSLDIYRGNTLLKRENFKGGVKQFTYPVKSEHQGGLSFVLTAIKDYTIFSKQQTVNVPWKSKNLNVTLSSFRDKLAPGEKETWRISVTDSNNKALEEGAVEILASMYDRSLDLFGQHYPTTVAPLYRRKYLNLRMSNNLGRSWGNFDKNYVLENISSSFEAAMLNNFHYINNSTLPTHRHPAVPGCANAISHTHQYSDKNHRHKYGCVEGDQMVEGAAPVVAEPMMAPAPSPVMAKPAPRALADKSPVNVQALQRKLKVDDENTNTVKNEVDTSSLDNIKTRTNFNETAFFYPHLVLEDNGSVAFEFEVPESLTDWKVWVSAITKDLRGGDLTAYTKTTKELVVRPYLPRFLRAGDQANIEVLINNTGDQALTGQMDFDVLDPETTESLANSFQLTNNKRNFTVAAGQSSRLRFPIKAPKDLGVIAIRARASASNGKAKFGDGEQRPLPVLPSRLYLSQSRFTALKAQTTKQLSFSELENNNDATLINENLVITIDGQLFYSTLNALPYLVDFPYECTEQTLNRFLSTSMISSVFAKHPALVSIVKDLSNRDSRLEQWDAIDKDPNRKMLLEETPWLNQAKGVKGSENMQRILNPEVVKSQYQSALKKLQKAQNDSGAFPWWEGGQDSTYMTSYLLQGFARALEFDVDVPKAMVQKAWKFLDKHYAKDFNNKIKQNTAEVVLINYVLSSYPDASWMGGAFEQSKRNQMLNQSFSQWKKLSPLSKAYLALSLKRAGRIENAKLVFDSIMDAAKTTEELGTFWPKQNRSWYWYNDNLDTHAFMLRTLMELDPEDERRHGLVQWLMMNKKLNHWKSTRATAESIYSLVHYLEKENQLGKEEKIQINIGNSVSETMVFAPNKYVGANNKVVVAGEDVSNDMANITIANQSESLMFASANWHFSTEKLPAEAQGDFFRVTRSFFKRVKKGNDWQLQPLADGATIAVGDQLEVQLNLFAKNTAEFVHLRAPRGAGFEPESQKSGYRWGNRTSYYEEIRDSGTNYFFDRLTKGEYTFKYRLRASTSGQFRIAPASIQSVYAPEFNAYSSGKSLNIK